MTRWRYREECGMGPSCQRPEQVSVKDGMLRVEMSKLEEPLEFPNMTVRFKGGGVITRDPLHFGFYEARIKLWESPGWWQSFWAATADSIDKSVCSVCVNASHPRQEIDVFEVNSGVNAFQYNFIKWNPLPRYYVSGRRMYPDFNLSEDWHVWGMEYTPIQTKLYLDGRLIGSGDWSSLFVHELVPFHIWFSAIITKHITHCMDEASLPAELLVDYFRFYTSHPGPNFYFEGPSSASKISHRMVTLTQNTCLSCSDPTSSLPAVSLTPLSQFSISFWSSRQVSRSADNRYFVEVPLLSYSRSDRPRRDLISVSSKGNDLLIRLGLDPQEVVLIEKYWTTSIRDDDTPFSSQQHQQEDPDQLEETLLLKKKKSKKYPRKQSNSSNESQSSSTNATTAPVKKELGGFIATVIGVAESTISDSVQNLEDQLTRTYSMLRKTEVNKPVKDSASSWTHVALTWRSFDGRLSVYKDGISVKSANVKVGKWFPSEGDITCLLYTSPSPRD
eukprot:TRINITY_DN47421_c0_g1_i8.p1 TRINITY_DN47421_c0_g1~~TRINITY_DN47421_c0_g1_i8.p1  ORF type:complete len:558 (-),score=21.69 TRINITY_DN47421_c0_g1_i8:4-1512(-)